MSAVALSSLGFTSACIIGPSLGGVLMLWINVDGCFIFYGVTLLFSGFELLLVRLVNTAKRSAGSNWLREVKEGLSSIGGAPLVLSSTLASYVRSTLVGCYRRF